MGQSAEIMEIKEMEETSKTVLGGKADAGNDTGTLTNGCQERRQLEARMNIRERTSQWG